MDSSIDGIESKLMSRTLSSREYQVMCCLAKGMIISSVASELCLSPNTVDTYVRRVYKKLAVHSRAEGVAKFCSGG